MRICVIGAGTAGAFSLLWLFEKIKLNKLKNAEIHCIYNPNISTTQVGESTSRLVNKALFNVLDYDILRDAPKFDGTLKWCAKYFWEEANGNNFTVRHNEPGFHINSEKFSFYVIDEVEKKFNNFVKIKDNVTNITQDGSNVYVSCEKNTYKYDYIIDCRGTPPNVETNKDYKAPDWVSVNSVIAYPEPIKTDELYTSAYVHKNGWMFGIPLTTRKTWGYLYNNTITSEEEAIKHFSEIRDIDTSKLRKLTWKQYYKKLAMDNRILYLGNRLYFFEPHQAMPLHYYGNVLMFFTGEVFNNPDPKSISLKVNQFHMRSVEELQDMVAINYAGLNNIKSPFWDYALEKSRKRLNSSIIFKLWCLENKDGIVSSYWSHPESILKDYFDGYKLEPKDFC